MEKVTQPQLKLEAASDNDGYLKLSINAEDVKECPPVDLLAVVDISGSMGGSCAGVTDGKTEYVDLGFSLMDLVKHAIKSIVLTMRDNDRFSLILFDDRQETKVELRCMTKENKEYMTKTIDALHPRGGTDIYNAIRYAIKQVRHRGDKGRETYRDPHILFFTDGQAGKTPPEGEVEALRKIKVKKNYNFPVHTYGFGQYNRLNSKMLYDISVLFGGMNGYIPDPTNIGTTFCNAVSNILTTAALCVKISIGHKVGGPIEEEKKADTGIMGKLSIWAKKQVIFQPTEIATPNQDHIKVNKEFYNATNRLIFMSDGSTLIDIGTVRYGQTTDILISFGFSKPQDLNMKDVKVDYFTQGKQFSVPLNQQINVCNKSEIQAQIFRFETIQLLLEGSNQYENIREAVHEVEKAKLLSFIEKWKKINLSDEVSEGIMKNLEDQCTTAMEKDKYMEKWGVHQFRQLVRALNMQVKINFRDPGVEHFGGELFEKYADDADDIYNNMEPPKPSMTSQERKQAMQPMTQQTFAQTYNTRGAAAQGCFTGDSKVKMADGSTKLVRNLKKGDKIATPQGPATIQCVLKYTKPGQAKVCVFENGLKITPHHPILNGAGQWVYPADVVSPEIIKCSEVYNLIVDHTHIAEINGVQLILMGHNYKTGILAHEYIGSQKIVKDLQNVGGWNKGLISFGENSGFSDSTRTQLQL